MPAVFWALLAPERAVKASKKGLLARTSYRVPAWIHFAYIYHAVLMVLALELLRLVVAAVQNLAALEAVAAGIEVEIHLLMGCKNYKTIMRFCCLHHGYQRNLAARWRCAWQGEYASNVAAISLPSLHWHIIKMLSIDFCWVSWTVDLPENKNHLNGRC